MFEFFKEIGLGLMMLLPLVNPLTTVALFVSLSKNLTIVERNKQAKLTSVYVFIIMLVTFYAGSLVMSIFGISIQGLRIAGGLIVFFIGFRMLFPLEANNNFDITKSVACKISKHRKTTNIAFVPLAMPSTAGPGTIAMILSWVSTNKNIYFSPWTTIFAPILVFLIISIVVWIALRSSNMIMQVLSAGSIQVISQVIGFLLECIGIQFIINGVFEIVTDYHA